MCYGSSRAIAAAFCSVGIDARVCPEGDDATRELAARCTSGDECLPQRVTLSDFLKIAEVSDFDPARTALFMPTASGPCRFGQYAVFFQRTLERLGYGQVRIVSPSCDNSYRDIASGAAQLPRLAWLGIVATDLLRRLLHMTRPYEHRRGDADQAWQLSLDDVCAVLERREVRIDRKLQALVQAMARSGARFAAISADYRQQRPLIGVVGEIYCRFNLYSNQDISRKIEESGGEVWLSDAREWIWYTHRSLIKELRRLGKALSRPMLQAVMSGLVQKRDEHRLQEPLAEFFIGVEEAEIDELLGLSEPYLPWEGALGEMVLSVGKTVYLQRKGADGVIDVSPFTCMNGIVSEAIYPAISRQQGGIPIRNIYVDGTAGNLAGDLDIFVELARNYRRHKQVPGPARSRRSAAA
jgi:predicted nucleotide-binding protein (sugar kinase/HSP70/actin superfamily)